MFLTAISNWKVGDELLAGSKLVKVPDRDVDREQTP
jgi:hypothetical protein